MNTGFLSGGDENVPELVLKAQLCEYTKNTDLYTLKGHTLWYMNYYLNKMVIKKIGGEFPGSPVVRTLRSHFWGLGFNLYLEN